MKRVLFVIAVLAVSAGFAYSAPHIDRMHIASDTDPITSSAGPSYIRGGVETYSKLACQIDGTSGTMNVDIDGSLDGVTFYSLQDDITAIGLYPITTKIFNYYLIDVDACSGGCSLTIICSPEQ